MAKKIELFVVVDGTDCVVRPSSRGDLTLDEAMKVERLAGIPFWSVKAGDTMPMPMWIAILTVQVQRTLPNVSPATVRKLTVDDLLAREVDDGLGDDETPAAGTEAAPDPTGGEVSSDASSPTSAPDISATSPTS